MYGQVCVGKCESVRMHACVYMCSCGRQSRHVCVCVSECVCVCVCVCVETIMMMMTMMMTHGGFHGDLNECIHAMQMK